MTQEESIQYSFMLMPLFCLLKRLKALLCGLFLFAFVIAPYFLTGTRTWLATIKPFEKVAFDVKYNCSKITLMIFGFHT